MTPLFQVTIARDAQSLYELAKYQLERRYSGKRLSLDIAVLLVVMALHYFMYRQLFRTLIIGCLLLFIFIWPYFSIRRVSVKHKQCQKQAEKLKQQASLGIPCEKAVYQFLKDNIRWETSCVSGYMEYSQIRSIEEFPMYFFVITTSKQALIIGKNSFTEGCPDQCLQFIRQKQQSGPAVPTSTAGAKLKG